MKKSWQRWKSWPKITTLDTEEVGEDIDHLIHRVEEDNAWVQLARGNVTAATRSNVRSKEHIYTLRVSS